MSAPLGTATLEEFLDLFRVLWFVRLLVYFLMLAGVIRLWKRGRSIAERFLIAGFILLIMAESMAVASVQSWIEIGYSPVYAAMMAEWEMMGQPEWAWWEPFYWWLGFVLRWLGLIVGAVGFVLSARGMARAALQGNLTGEEPTP